MRQNSYLAVRVNLSTKQMVLAHAKPGAQLEWRARETEAEPVSFVVCNAIGLETGTAAHDSIQLYQGDARLLTESLERIQQTANRILNAIRAEVEPM